MPATNENAERVLILAPFGRDAQVIATVLNRNGIATEICSDVDSLATEIATGGGAAILADEALNRRNVERLAEVLKSQPPWSDFPLLVMTGTGESTIATRHRLELIAPLGNITLIERPLRTATMMSSVRAALRARRQQYEIAKHLDSHVQAATSLKDSEGRLRFALDVAHLGDWELHLPNRDLNCSPQCKKNFGAPLDEPFTYESLIAMIHPADRQRVLAAMEEAIEKRSSFETEYRVVTPDGSERWIFSVGRFMVGTAGEKCLRGVALDISERRRSEAAIRDSELQLRTLADSIPQLAWMAEADGTIFWYNQCWYDYTGRAPQAVDALGATDLHHPDILPRVIEQWHRSIATGEPFEMEFPLRGADGAFRWFLTRIRPLRGEDGRVSRWFGTSTDIDEQRNTREALRENERKLQFAIEAARMGEWQIEFDTLQMKGSPRFDAIVGTPQGAAGWTLETFRQHVHPDDRYRVSKLLDEAIHHQSDFEAEFRIERGDDPPGWVWARSSIYTESDGARRMLGLIRDISESKRFEERLRESARLESLGVLAGGIAHDFNNLLVGIIGNASLLRDCLTSPADLEVVDNLVEAGERAAKLTQQMLAYSGRGRFVVQNLDLSEQVSGITALISAAIPKNVNLRLELGAVTPVEADATQLQQLIMNLVINAAEALGPVGGVVTVLTGVENLATALVSEAMAGERIPAGKYTVLMVADTGVGMDEPTKKRIFDPFFTTKFTGRGLGLSAVIGIVRGHRGAIQVDTAPGCGTTFRVYLPVVVSPRSAMAPAHESSARGEGTILLVDDEDMVRRMAAVALRKAGYDVLLAKNGREAIEVFQASADAVQAVLLDMTMPLMNGDDALKEIRRIRPDVPVLASSGYNEVEALHRFGREINGFLQKPYTYSQLAVKIRKILG